MWLQIFCSAIKDFKGLKRKKKKKSKVSQHTICPPMNSLSGGHDVTAPVWNNAKQWQIPGAGMDALVSSGWRAGGLLLRPRRRLGKLFGRTFFSQSFKLSHFLKLLTSSSARCNTVHLLCNLLPDVGFVLGGHNATESATDDWAVWLINLFCFIFFFIGTECDHNFCVVAVCNSFLTVWKKYHYIFVLAPEDGKITSIFLGQRAHLTELWAIV